MRSTVKSHLPDRKGKTYEDYVGRRGLERLGRHVHDASSSS
jgi:hypothetical protein